MHDSYCVLCVVITRAGNWKACKKLFRRNEILRFKSHAVTGGIAVNGFNPPTPFKCHFSAEIVCSNPTN